MTTYKFGAQQRLAHGWTVRGGYSYGTQPIASNDVMFNILAPGVEQQHVSFGLTAPVAKTQRLSLAVTRAFSNTVSGANPLEAPGRQNIALTMNQWDVQFGYAIGFGR
jgi:long-chain fatty acid transport protein